MPLKFSLAIAGIVTLLALPISAQTGTVSGTIRDAESAAPIADATVTLDGGTHAAFPAAGSAFVRGTRSTRTGDAGEYRFNGVEPGDYRLHVQRMGYRSATVEVTLRSPAESRLSVGLQVQPVTLKPIHVTPGQAARDTYGRRTATGGGEEAGEERVEAERARQRTHLASDVRGTLDPATRLRLAPPGLPPVVRVHPDASQRATVLEVRTEDRPGVLWAVCDALTRLGLDVRSAHVATVGPQAHDVFYVRQPGSGPRGEDQAATAVHAVRRALGAAVTLDA